MSDSESDFNSARLQGRIIMGLWTNGKMVMLDNLVNNMDFGLGTRERRHRDLKLYESTLNHDGWVPVSGGRNGSRDGGDLPRGTSNANYFDSLEHRLFMFDHMEPVSPGDIPWIVGKGMATDEIVFDDFNNPDGFIISTMVPASKNNRFNYFEFLSGGTRAVANDATALPNRWSIPTMGLVKNARVEQVANGGIKGRGLWLNGDNSSVEYTIPSNSRDVNGSPWYIGLFLDRRYSDTTRNLISFSDGSSVRVDGSGNFEFLNVNDVVVERVEVPATVQRRSRPDGRTGWAHIGLNVDPSINKIQVFYNGFFLKSFVPSGSMFGMGAGKLYLGASPTASVAGFRGWIDDFKIFAQNVNLEVACNHANGTLIGLEKNTGGGWVGIAESYPNGHWTIQQLVRAAGGRTNELYACRHDYSGDYVLNMSNIKPQFKSIHEAINFPEGPLRFGQPRPDSSDNAFCLSCHTAEGKKGFGLDALTLNASVMAEDDPRRQPTQPDARVYGNIPANWLGRGKPAAAMDAGSEGIAIDRWLLDGSNTPNAPTPAPAAPVSTGPAEVEFTVVNNSEDDSITVMAPEPSVTSAQPATTINDIVAMEVIEENEADAASELAELLGLLDHQESQAASSGGQPFLLSPADATSISEIILAALTSDLLTGGLTLGAAEEDAGVTGEVDVDIDADADAEYEQPEPSDGVAQGEAEASVQSALAEEDSPVVVGSGAASNLLLLLLCGVCSQRFSVRRRTLRFFT